MKDLVPVRGATNVPNQYMHCGSQMGYYRNPGIHLRVGAQNYHAANHYPLSRTIILVHWEYTHHDHH
jgi:hypothetical protein